MQKLKLTLLLTLLLLCAASTIYGADPAVNSYEITTNKTGACEPVTVTMDVRFTVDDYSGDDVKLAIDWKWEGENTLDLLKESVEVFEVGAGSVELVAEGNNTFSISVSHEYDSVNSKTCYVDIKPRAIVDGGQTGQGNTSTIVIWGEDNSNGGSIKLDSKIKKVCVGDKDVCLGFEDLSIWNCVPRGNAGELLEANIDSRWTQWIYGTNDPDFNSTISIKDTLWDDYDPKPYPAVVGKHQLPSESDPQKDSIVLEPIGVYRTSKKLCFKEVLRSDLDKEFEFTLYNWNACNPYADEDGNILDNEPIKTTGVIKVIDVPKPKILPSLNYVCANVLTLDLLKSSDMYGYVEKTSIDSTDVETWEWTGGYITKGRYFDIAAALENGNTHWIKFKAAYDELTCAGYDSIEVTIVSAPVFEIDDAELSLCLGDSVLLKPNPTFIGEGTAFELDYDWTGNGKDFLSSKDSEAPYFRADAEGDYPKLRAWLEATYKINGETVVCDANMKYSIHVDDLDVYFNEDTIILCPGEKIVLNPKIPNEGKYNLGYSWSAITADNANADYCFERKKDIRNVEFTALKTGVYNCIFSATNLAENGCTAMDYVVVKVYDKPDASIGTVKRKFRGLKTSLVGADSDLTKKWQFESTTSGGQIVGFEGAASNVVNVEVSKEGLYTFSYTVYNSVSGCESSETITIEFIEDLNPIDKNYSFCGTASDALKAIPANNAEAGGYWSSAVSNPSAVTFGDKSNNVTTVEVVLPGDYILYWVDVNRSKDDAIFNKDSATIKVNFVQQPAVDFTMNQRKGCSPLTVKCNNTTNGGSYNYSWEFGSDVSTVNSPTYTFKNKTQQNLIDTVKLTAFAKTDGLPCSAEKKVAVTIYPNADAILDGSSGAACSPIRVEFENKSLNAIGYDWHIEFDDDDIKDFSKSILSVEGGVFKNENTQGAVKDRKVRLVAEHQNGCTDTITQYVTVAPSSPVTFTMDKRRICTGEEIVFDAETGAMTYDWDFGDTIIYDLSRLHFSKAFINNSENDVQHIIKLKATTAIGCDTTFSDTLLVRGNIKADFTVSPTEGVKSLTALIHDKSDNADSVRWAWGDRSADSTAYNFSNAARKIKHFYLNETFWPQTYYLNQYAYRYYNYNLLGDTLESCMDHVAESIELIPAFKIDFDVNSIFCSPAVVHFDNTSTGASKFVWDFGDGSPKEKTFYPIHDYEYDAVDGSPQTYTVTLTGQSSWIDETTGEYLKQTVTKDVTIYPTIEVGFNVEINATRDALILRNYSSGASTYRWIVDRDTVYSSTADDYRYYIGDNVKFQVGFNASLLGISGPDS